MEDFRVSTDGKVTLITCAAKGFTMQVEKDRKFMAGENLAFLEATLYREAGTFIPGCSYGFQVIFNDKVPAGGGIDVDLCRSVVSFFFHSILGTPYFITSIPPASSLYAAPVAAIDHSNEINTSDLYDLLSGY
jgi:hypothetical protein